MKKVRNIRRQTVLIDTLKTETSNFVLNPSLHWKPVVCSQQCCCTCMPGLTKDKRQTLEADTLTTRPTMRSFWLVNITQRSSNEMETTVSINNV